ncbi:pyridoxamine 5'-phosphate oxidase family protein [Peptostreptococcus stomatis]|uniref:pyridoxamine 5'-phosphate oxidase family protein n=1 Tax=Peptostreptococcus stomatis TaxID=341694 RepID=UPI0028D8CE4C|nr:pyridoxamine 5'-phosphate oxidase family protein [Peptostreptococcus stomatis]
MFRQVRRKNREISLEAAKDLLRTSRRGVLAVNGDNGYPYALPLNYIYDENNQTIIFHGARAGHKLDSIKACDKVCFTVYGNETIKEEAWAPYMQSVIVFGRCKLVDNQERSMDILRDLARKYYPSEDIIDEEIAKAGKAVQMFQIEIEHISGKEIQEK